MVAVIQKELPELRGAFPFRFSENRKIEADH
jgi:hypothetical protein